MKDFKKFVKTEDSKKQKVQKKCEEINKTCNMNLPEDIPEISDIDPSDINMVKNLAEKYQGNKDMLINDIVNLAAKNKKEGKLDNSQLEEFEEKITPMLNSEQKKMLNQIMRMIK